MAGQIIIALVVYIILERTGFPTFITVPGTSFELELGWGYGLLILFMLVGDPTRLT